MALITVQIQEQNWELIRTQIGAVLLLELLNQTYITDLGISEIWLNRNIPFSENEIPAINVLFDGADYDQNTNISNRANPNEYFIDVVTNSQHTESAKGDSLASIMAQRIAGIIRYILSAPQYGTLGFDPGLIHTTWVESIKMGQLNGNDTMHSIVARVVFKVVANECQQDIQPVTAEGYDSQVKIDETDLGYKMIVNN